MRDTIKSFVKKNSLEFHRYNSWQHCYEAFGKDNLDTDTLALHLGFYLASWGMYRGSSQLLQNDYKVHLEPVNILNSYKHLRCNQNYEITLFNLPKILELIKELSIYYDKKHNITPTDTLISKIILGTLGCLPAYDRFFIDGVKQLELKSTTLKEKSLRELFKFIESNEEELKNLKTIYPQYTQMKFIDMYFWQLGFDISKRKII
ncbi:hypothetical protein [Christiangramia forsetii]|uniref:Uncharacterized protein n=2 Tax=Christiangramia forsetii TaxID=411153 RepID=A0LZ58_CHRFK|nr:hypothetical protein [Christiangramia forsetii]GGG37512.1 hypothetical protein GCM10011532_21480 [Christiangramia forsetii]CAL65653.1 conserved hypothetical protein [Christiangramia forsetii KT0803]